MLSIKKLYGDGSKELQELERIATMTEEVIKHKLYDEKVDRKSSLHLSIVK